MTSELSPVFLNDKPVPSRQPKPKVADLVAAGGQDPNRVVVRQLEAPRAAGGRSVPLEQVIDRTASPGRPIYLTATAKDGQTASQKARRYEPKSYDRLIGTPGFSEQLLRDHFGLYEGYVKHTNTCLELLRSGSLDPYVAGELRRRLGWEFNGMSLHEFYFDGMTNGGQELAKDAGLHASLAAEFGSFEGWWKQFQALGAMRGIGWAVLQHDPVADRLINTWINEHDAGALAGTNPILVLDLFEHAYIRDYGTDRTRYLGAFANAVDWATCERRWTQSAQHHNPRA